MANQEHRYPGIQPFSAQQERIFFGRDDDRERLLSLIRLEKLTVLFAKSGYGKSSLLNAAIAPALERENPKMSRRFLPVFIRFNAWDEHDQRPWLERFRFHFTAKVPVDDPDAYRARAYLPQTLWGEIKRRQTGQSPVYVLIFDQFEEFFTYPLQQQTDFKQQLAELLYADIPAFVEQNEASLPPAEASFVSEKVEAKAVLSIRADRLGELHRMKDRLPAILHKRFELTTLNENQAREALEKPAALEGDFISPPFSYAPEASNFLIGQLAQNARGETGGVEAFQLQIIAQDIESRVANGQIAGLDSKRHPLVQKADLPRLDNIYAEYYRRKIEELPVEKQLPARRLLEDGLLFVGEQGDARRISMDGGLLAQQFGVDQNLLKTLENTFLLRREANAMQGYNYELSHDTLVAPVLEAKRERQAEEEKGAAEKKGRRLFLLAIGLAILVAGMAIFAGWAYRQKLIAEAAKQEKENALLEKENALHELEIKEASLRKSEADRLKQEFYEILQRTENEIAGQEPELAAGDIGLLRVKVQTIAELGGDTTQLHREMLNIQKLQSHGH